jgi:hypothetical protein
MACAEVEVCQVDGESKLNRLSTEILELGQLGGEIAFGPVGCGRRLIRRWAFTHLFGSFSVNVK